MPLFALRVKVGFERSVLIVFVMGSESNSPTKKKRKLFLSLSKDKKRFNVTTTDELEPTSTKFVPKTLQLR